MSMLRIVQYNINMSNNQRKGTEPTKRKSYKDWAKRKMHKDW